ncbi:MAG: adenylate kinase [Planctomycetota bacterium]
MRLVFLGPPGSGKGTQAGMLADRTGILHLSTGDILRGAAALGTPTGMKAKGFMDKGNLVPDAVVDALVAERLTGADTGAFVLDGYPRNVAQAEALAGLLAAEGIALDAVLFLNVADEVLVARIAGRRDRRPDDTEEVVRARLDVYRAETEPLVTYYEGQGLLRRINGEQPIDAVRDAVAAALEGTEA